MTGILCEQCGYMNPEGSTECEICAEPLVKSTPSPSVVTEMVEPNGNNSVHTEKQNEVPAENNGVEYFVMCPESSTKTIISNPNATSYFCEGCHTEHPIDGYIWAIESRQMNDNKIGSPESKEAPKGDKLWLEEINSHFRIDIAKPGGTLGRYGTFGGDYFRSRNMNTIHGEHCEFKYEFNVWTLTRLGANDTKYNGMIMERFEPTMLEDGKELTLSNIVTFIVRIG